LLGAQCVQVLLDRAAIESGAAIAELAAGRDATDGGPDRIKGEEVDCALLGASKGQIMRRVRWVPLMPRPSLRHDTAIGWGLRMRAARRWAPR
jgi:hypothetical protein